MRDPVILDTHALIWLVFGEPELGPTALEVARGAGADHHLLVSAFTFWEVGMLVAHQRLSLREAPSTWRWSVLQWGIEEVPVTGDLGIMAAEPQGFHKDPADRLITATALTRGATLITSDRRILGWRGSSTQQDACAPWNICQT